MEYFFNTPITLLSLILLQNSGLSVFPFSWWNKRDRFWQDVPHAAVKLSCYDSKDNGEGCQESCCGGTFFWVFSVLHITCLLSCVICACPFEQQLSGSSFSQGLLRNRPGMSPGLQGNCSPRRRRHRRRPSCSSAFSSHPYLNLGWSNAWYNPLQRTVLRR